MLSAAGEWSHARSRTRSVVFLAPGLRAFVTERRGLLFDSRFACATGPRHGIATLYLVRTGTFHPSGATPIHGESAWALRESEFERIQPGARTFRSYGDPCLSIAAVVPEHAVLVPLGIDAGPLAVGRATWAAVDELFAALGDPRREALFTAVLEGLVDDGVLSRGLVDSVREAVEPAARQRLWRVLATRFAEHDTSVHVDLFGALAGVSSRQVGRGLGGVVRAFPLFDSFRNTVKTLRLRRAVLLLSAESLRVSDVAKIVGYGSGDAMGRAFRDAGLPAPSTVRDAVRGEAEAP